METKFLKSAKDLADEYQCQQLRKAIAEADTAELLREKAKVELEIQRFILGRAKAGDL